jgi:hypothetical protein
MVSEIVPASLNPVMYSRYPPVESNDVTSMKSLVIVGPEILFTSARESHEDPFQRLKSVPTPEIALLLPKAQPIVFSPISFVH